jgi:cytochrome c oxidase assembly factor CtaG
MLQHLLLIAIVPPLLVLGASPGSFLLAFTSPARRIVGQWWHRTTWLKSAWGTLTQQLIAWALNILTLWIWHIPRLYQTALENEALHLLEHFCFVTTSLLFWWTVTRPSRGNPGILALFTMALQGGLLGALITFAPSPWYPIYALTTQQWGLLPLEDQQLAGAIMWIPAGIIYTVAALILFSNRLLSIERQANQRERLMMKECKGITGLELREE